MKTILRFYNDHELDHDPLMDELTSEISGLRIMNINVESNPQSATDYNVRFIPTYILVVGGKETSRKEGSSSFSELLEWLIYGPGSI